MGRKPFSWRFTTPLFIGSSLNAINSSMIATALVPIAAGLHVSVGQTASLVAALYLASAIAQPTAGKIAEVFTTPPAGTAELVLIVQDPDVPLGKPATHALARGIDPSLGGIPEYGLADPSPIRGIKHGKGSLGRRGWAGPLPMRSHGPHSYVFQLFALDYPPGLPDKFTLADTLHAMTGHAIARARLDGTYEIR